MAAQFWAVPSTDVALGDAKMASDAVHRKLNPTAVFLLPATFLKIIY